MPLFPAPSSGQAITMSKGVLNVPDNPIIPFIEGDGTGPDIWRASQRVLDAAVEKAYAGKRKIAWYEVYAGEKSFRQFKSWLPDETVEAYRTYLVGIKGPLTTPIGKGIRSLNVALRQMLDLYVCLRPVRWFKGVPSPVRDPSKVDMVIFRENTEDIYAGIEWEAESDGAKKVIAFLQDAMGVKKIRFPETSGIGIKPVSRDGSQRLVRAAIEYALQEKRKSVTFVHKGNIMKFTEGAFRDWGYELAMREFRGRIVTERESWVLGNKEKDANLSVEANAKMIEPGYDMAPPDMQAEFRAEVESALKLWETHGQGKWKGMLRIKDSIADITLQQVLTRPDEFDVIATLNLNGDYLSDALAAQVGGIGIAPGGNINYVSGHAIFEATHGTAPKYANLDKVNPGSVILSGEMMLRHMGWREAADLVIKGVDGAITARTVTYDFARLMEGAREVKCSAFGEAIIAHMLRPRTFFEQETSMAKRNKIGIIGAGNIGGELARLVASKELGDAVMLDIPSKANFAKGKALDLEQNSAVLGYDASITGTSEWSDLSGANVLIITAGIPRKPGQSRDDLVAVNVPIIRDVADNAKKHCPDAFVVVISNPLDAMVYEFMRRTGADPRKVVGMAGVLDSGRFSLFLARAAGVSVKDVRAMVLGGHGDDMVPILSQCTVNGVPATKLVAKDALEAIVKRTRGGGGEVVNLMGTSAYYAPASSAISMAEAYLHDQKRLLPCACYLNGEYGYKDLYVGVPAMIGGAGVEKIVEVELTPEEKSMLEKSVGSVRSVVDVVKRSLGRSCI